MAKPELGSKRVCVSCQTRFYDLTRAPAVCPKCGTEQPVEQPRPRRLTGNVAEERRIKKPVPEPGIEEVEVEGVEDVEEEDVLEDADRPGGRRRRDQPGYRGRDGHGRAGAVTSVSTGPSGEALSRHGDALAHPVRRVSGPLPGGPVGCLPRETAPGRRLGPNWLAIARSRPSPRRVQARGPAPTSDVREKIATFPSWHPARADP